VNWDEWIQAIEINLFARYYVPALSPTSKRRIRENYQPLGGGATAPLPRISAYAASKAAVVRMTETLAEELRDWKIDVNAMPPARSTRVCWMKCSRRALKSRQGVLRSIAQAAG